MSHLHQLLIYSVFSCPAATMRSDPPNPNVPPLTLQGRIRYDRLHHYATQSWAGEEVATPQISKTGTSHTQLAIDLDDRTTVPKSSNPSPRTCGSLHLGESSHSITESGIQGDIGARPPTPLCFTSPTSCPVYSRLTDLAGDEERDPNQSPAPTSLCGPNPSISQWGDGKRHGSTAEPFGAEHG